MGLKKGKYAYLEISPGRYVKVRVIKSKADDSPKKYRVVSGVTKHLPITATSVKIDSVPEAARKSVLDQLTT